MERVFDLSGEPSIRDVLDEPAIQRVMAHDGVSRADIDALIDGRRRPSRRAVRPRATPVKQRRAVVKPR